MSRRWVTAIEIVVAFVAAALFTFWCSLIHGDPVERMGQVSGLATVAFRFILVVVPLIGALALAVRYRKGEKFDQATRYVCAALAGIASGAFAGGIAFALRGTEYGIGGTFGDVGVLASWADSIKRGDYTYSSVYPPLQVYVLVWISDLFDMPTQHAIKVFQIVGVAAIGPATYAAWRLLMRPAWALGLAVVTMAVLIEPYRPYAGLVLCVLVPVLIKFLDVLRNVGEMSLHDVLKSSAVFGVGLGLLCLLYSGWYQWSAPGVVAAGLIVFPWKDWRRGALFCGIAGILFALCVFHYVMGFRAGPGVKDAYVYVDALQEPTYFAMWRGGAPGDEHWMPLGELGGIGVFTLILVVGLGIAIALGRRQTSVTALVSLVVGCWLFRLWHAHNMYATKLVQLWPRTSAEILCCMLVLCVIALYLVLQRLEATSVWRSPSATIGAVASLAFVVMSASSTTTDLYMARDAEGTVGHLAWISHNLSQKHPAVSRGAKTITSSSLENADFSARWLTDGNYTTPFSSALGRTEDHEETIEIQLDRPRKFTRVVLFTAGDGFPLDFDLDVWDGSHWLTRQTVKSANEPSVFMAVKLGGRGYEETTAFRIRATRLRKATGTNDYVLRLSEIELR